MHDERCRDWEHANLWGLLRRCCGCLVVVRGVEAGIAPAEGILERIVQHGCPHPEEGLHRRPVPAHLLFFVHALGHDLVDRALHKGSRDRLAASTPGGVVYQRAFIALEVAQQLTGVPPETSDTGYVAHMLALRPATQGREFAPASRPAPMPQAPFRTLQAANRLVGQVRAGCVCAKAAGRLQRVPPVQHDRGLRQRLALQPPQPGVAIAQHGCRCVRMYSGHGERLLERVGGDRGAVARESEAGLDAMSVDHLARDHLKMALLLPVSTADVAAINKILWGLAAETLDLLSVV